MFKGSYEASNGDLIIMMSFNGHAYNYSYKIYRSSYLSVSSLKSLSWKWGVWRWPRVCGKKKPSWWWADWDLSVHNGAASLRPTLSELNFTAW